MTISKVVPVENGTEGSALTGAAGVYSGTIDLPDGTDGKEAFADGTKYVLRVYLAWTNDDAKSDADTLIGKAAPNVTFTLKIDAKQHIA